MTCYIIALHAAVYSLYLHRYSLYAFSWAATYVVYVFPTIIGIDCRLVSSINTYYINVWYVSLSKTIARYLFCPPLCVISIEDVLAATNLCIVCIFSCIGSPSYLENLR